MDPLNKVIERYDPRVAAGILARAAMAVEAGQEFPRSIVDNEESLRAALIADARIKAGIAPEDNSVAAIQKIGSVLDAESDRIAPKPDERTAVERLIARGDFPSDLYDIRINRNLVDFFGKDLRREPIFIQLTVKRPTREQHFRADETNPEAPSMISLFARQFRTPFPARNFTMLVAGQRGRGKILDVHMAWRLYPLHVDVEGAADLIQLLRRFAEKYGADITLNGVRGRFFLSTLDKVPDVANIDLPKSKHRRTAMITRFFQQRTIRDSEGRLVTQDVSSLVMAIDLDLYRATLKNLDSKEIK
jgi:hypothetical protein